ncbi:hypothetical protein SAMN02745746_00128 [Pseudogulbenkiania subflava DSM 22618]|uniref:Uncharacterized protein n=1 Tax=Pseudogulbenkiania subflava DSM 22618 TaxID=1123014 RepID=A0A1Y6BBY1_9NEIS|nr:hypothetical protein SAMN02745746_00128 [Pseudogulbenkiania subflava DSM 22618]
MTKNAPRRCVGHCVVGRSPVQANRQALCAAASNRRSVGTSASAPRCAPSTRHLARCGTPRSAMARTHSGKCRWMVVHAVPTASTRPWSSWIRPGAMPPIKKTIHGCAICSGTYTTSTKPGAPQCRLTTTRGNKGSAPQPLPETAAAPAPCPGNVSISSKSLMVPTEISSTGPSPALATLCGRCASKCKESPVASRYSCPSTT